MRAHRVKGALQTIPETNPLFYDAQRMRFELLRALYLHAREHPGEVFSESDLEQEFAVSPLQFDLVIEWLVRSGYVVCDGPEGNPSITEKGNGEMEARGLFWRLEVDAIVSWLDEEKARITRDCATLGLPKPEASRLEIAQKKDAVTEARRRRIAVQARLRDLNEPFVPN